MKKGSLILALLLCLIAVGGLAVLFRANNTETPSDNNSSGGNGGSGGFAVSQKLLYGRYNGDESKKDIHEKDFAYLQRCRSSAAYAIETLGWIRVDCTENGEMRSIEDISDSIFALIKERFADA